MPLIAAVVLYGGIFFGYAGYTNAHGAMESGAVLQSHTFALKQAAIERVEFEMFLKELPGCLR